jgi:hypothetical protein
LPRFDSAGAAIVVPSAQSIDKLALRVWSVELLKETDSMRVSLEYEVHLEPQLEEQREAELEEMEARTVYLMISFRPRGETEHKY